MSTERARERSRAENKRRRAKERGIYPKGYRHVDEVDPNPEARAERVARMAKLAAQKRPLFPEKDAS